MSIESKVSNTLLQTPIEIKIGSRTYSIAPPSIATLVMVSDLLSRTPELPDMKEADVLKWSLKNAKDCRFVGEILAILILGAKGLKGKKEVIVSRFWGLYKTTKVVDCDFKRELTDDIVLNHTPVEINRLMSQLLERLEIGSFFFTISFLQEVRLTKPTKNTATTASGQ